MGCLVISCGKQPHQKQYEGLPAPTTNHCHSLIHPSQVSDWHWMKAAYVRDRLIACDRCMSDYTVWEWWWLAARVGSLPLLFNGPAPAANHQDPPAEVLACNPDNLCGASRDTHGTNFSWFSKKPPKFEPCSLRFLSWIIDTFWLATKG